MIEPNAPADLTVVDPTHPLIQPLFDPRRGLIALANRADIAQVVVDRTVLIADGRFTGSAQLAIAAACAAAIERIWTLPEVQAAFRS